MAETVPRLRAVGRPPVPPPLARSAGPAPSAARPAAHPPPPPLARSVGPTPSAHPPSPSPAPAPSRNRTSGRTPHPTTGRTIGRDATVDPAPETAATGLYEAARLFADSVSSGLIDPGTRRAPSPDGTTPGVNEGVAAGVAADRRRRARLRTVAVVGGVVAAGVAALACAVLVLVVLRWPDRPEAPSAVAPLDAAVARALVADRLLSVVTWVEYVATLLVLGGALFRTFVSRPALVGRGASERVLIGAALAGIVACLASLPLRALVLAEGGLDAIDDLDVFELVATSRFGDAACLRMVALALLALILVRPPQGWERRVRIIRPQGTLLAFVSLPRRLAEGVAVAAAGAVAVASFLVVGHPQATEPRGPLVASQAVHVVAAAVWFGGGAVLALEIHRQRRHETARCTAQTVARFSVLAGGAVALAAVTGVVLAASQLDSPGALTSTAYGRALAAKTVLAGLVVALGAYNHFRLVPAVVGGDDGRAWRRLGRVAAAEAVVITVGVLVATAAMTSGGF